MLCCDWLVFNSCDQRISNLAVAVNCFLGGPLSYSSPAVVFLDRQIVGIHASEFLLNCPIKLYVNDKIVLKFLMGTWWPSC